MQHDAFSGSTKLMPDSCLGDRTWLEASRVGWTKSVGCW